MKVEQMRDSQVSKEICVCPWQMVHLFDNFLRPLLHNPQKLFGPHLRTGMTVLDIGCGRGFASLGLAQLVGEDGIVISADLQPEMLEMVKQRAASFTHSRKQAIVSLYILDKCAVLMVAMPAPSQWRETRLGE